MPFANLDIKFSNKDISKTITACSLRFGQLKEDDIDYVHHPFHQVNNLVKRMVDKLIVGGIVFHKHNF